jgi:hypothetical protein
MKKANPFSHFALLAGFNRLFMGYDYKPVIVACRDSCKPPARRMLANPG